VSLEATARYFRVLGDPTRLRLLEALLERERSVGELVRLLGVPQGRVSNHLACLKWCRLVEAERRGQRVIYRVTDPRVRELLERAAPLVEANRRHLESCERIGPAWV
jgi:DNA-binding transcriptional ArsR family regulator